MARQTMVELQAQVLAEFPTFKLVGKRTSRFMRAIDWVLRILTFNKMRDFMDRFVTTIGCVVYVPDRWDTWSETSRIIVLRHERVHMRQRKKYGVWFGFLYLFVLPTIWAIYRLKFEMEAYEESLRAGVEFYGSRAIEFMRESIIKDLTGPNYFWCCVKKSYVERWYDRTAARLLGR